MIRGKKILIIGGGPAGLMAAACLSSDHEVHLYEKEKTIGRKFLVAGKGGFNLTNEKNGAELTAVYSPTDFLQTCLSDFDALDFRKWLAELGIETFVGTSGRVFPVKGIKPIEVLQKIKKRILDQGVQIHLLHEFKGFETPNKVVVENEKITEVVHGDAIVLALGGASWPKTGSTGKWLSYLHALDIQTKAFQSSNCGINIDWPDTVRSSHAGKPLKNIQLKVHDRSIQGEALVTDYGLEGNAIYPLIPFIRQELNKGKKVSIQIDFKPRNTIEQLSQKIKTEKGTTKNYAKLLNLNKTQLAILKAYTDKESFLSKEKMIYQLKHLALPIQSLRPLTEAISSVGGIDLTEVNTNFSLKKHPTIFVLGEMLDWDAPTGGFLLQACFSMGWSLAKFLNEKFA